LLWKRRKKKRVGTTMMEVLIVGLILELDLAQFQIQSQYWIISEKTKVYMNGTISGMSEITTDCLRHEQEKGSSMLINT